MSLKETVKQLWVRKIEKRYDKLLSEKRVGYDEWVKRQEKKAEKNVNIAGRSSDYVLFLQEDGCLSGKALQILDQYFQDNPEVQILYGDEDLMTDEGVREQPWYKPCWSPDTYLSQFYPGSAVAVRKGIAQNIQGQILFKDPEEIREALSRYIKTCGGFEKGCRTIARCPHILFHVNNPNVWERYLNSTEKEDVLLEERNDTSVIIPSKDNPEILKKCLNSLKEIAGLEIIIVDNGSSMENKKRIRAMVDAVNADIMRRQTVRFLYQAMEFNFSKMCNMGAEVSTGRYLLFLNDDIEAYGREWFYAMRAKAAKPYVGAVGLKLYYPESIRIQHAGITNLPVGPVHKMQFAEDDRSIYFDRNKADMNCMAVTGACLMIDKFKYAEAGGFNESLRVAYNDVDLGFALYEAGYQNVVINSYFAYHHESLSRGSDESREKLARLQAEREKLYKLHPMLRNEDPYYPSGLSKDGLDSRIVPGYINALNTVQTAGMEHVSLDMKKVRVDNCLFLGIEQSEHADVKGYGVVLGDNNACYDRYVVLASPDAVNAGDTDFVPALVVKTENQYRQDLEENMQDQMNVAMCGFHVHFPEAECAKMPEGAEYRIGVMAVHKINKGRLLNWSGRYFKR